MSSFINKLSKENMGKTTYIKRNKLGEGSYGIVYEVEDKDSGNIYADKMSSSTPDLNELDILCKIDHPHVLQAVDFYYASSDSSFHIILPKADKDLDNYSEIKNVLKGNLTLNEAIKMIYEIISAVSFLHKLGYFHCDVKPRNILMFGNKPVLSDFGWTYFLGYNTGEVCGTTTFTSPECVTPKLSSTLTPYNKSCEQIKADIYSLGSTFFYLLTGKLLIEYDSDNIMLRANYSVVEHKLQNYINSISEPYVSLRECFECILEMCKAEPDERLKSIEEVLQQPVFLSRGLSEPIGGKVKVTNIPNTVCNNLTSKDIEPLISRLFQVSLELQDVYSKYGYNLYELCILPSLYIRSIATLGSSPKGINIYIDRYIAASIYIANNLSGKETQEIDKYIKYTQVTSSLFYSTVIKCIQNLEGCLSMPIIYPMTDNGLECFWYITQCLVDGCSFVFTHPTEVHRYYSLLEERQPELKDLRFLKNQNNILECNIYPDTKVFIIVIKEMMNGRSNVTLKISYNPSSRPSISSLDYSNKETKRWVEIVEEKKEQKSDEPQGSSNDPSLIIKTLRKGNYNLALQLIHKKNKKEDAWITRDIIDEVFESIKQQTTMTNRKDLVEIFYNIMKGGDTFEKHISYKLSDIYYSKKQVQLDLINDCIKEMIIRSEYDAIMFEIVLYALSNSYFRFCDFIFDIYIKVNYSHKLLSTLNEIIGDEDIMRQMDDIEDAENIINKYIVRL